MGWNLSPGMGPIFIAWQSGVTTTFATVSACRSEVTLLIKWGLMMYHFLAAIGTAYNTKSRKYYI